MWCDRLIEMGWLAAIIVVPLFFNIYSSRVFEPDKLTTLRSNATCMSLARPVKVGMAGRSRIEGSAEVTNLFNTVQWSSVTGNAIAVNTLTGLPTGTVPTSGDQLIPTGGYEQRQLQLGFRFQF